jgi:quinol monooxygenase YgiN
MARSVRIIAHVSARSGSEDALKALLLELVSPTRAEAGCLRYELLQNHITPTEFVFIEEWESNEALTAHLNSSHLEEVFREGQTFLAAPPEIQHYELLA